MSYKNLHEFINTLVEHQEIIRIHAPVSPFLEIAEITDRVSKSSHGGKALLFENVIGSSFPVLTNAFGSEKRMALSLGIDNLDQLSGRLQEFLESDIPKTIGDKIRLFKKVLEFSRYIPRISKQAHPPCQEIIHRGEEINLFELPVLQCWPHDAAPFITLPVVLTKHASTGKRNVGMYRMQIMDKNTTGMHWHIHKDGAYLFNDYVKSDRRMAVAVAIGTDPVITYVASSPMPRGIDELLFAGFIRRKPICLVPAVTIDIEVPADAEIVLEGYIDPLELRMEGPFGDHTGYYSPPDLYPVFHVTALTHRKDALYSTTIVGKPPMEDCYLGTATERIFLPLLRTFFPEIRDYWLPWEGVFHNAVIVSIDKRYPGHARKIMYGLWGLGQMSFSKVIVIVDESSNLRDGYALLREILLRIDFQRDVFITEGIADALDHAAPHAHWGGKIGIDATATIDGEIPRKCPMIDGNYPSPDDIIMRAKALDDGFNDCRVLFPGLQVPLIIFRIEKTLTKRGSFYRDILLNNNIIPRCIAIFFDENIDNVTESVLLWKILSNVDPMRDTSLRDQMIIIDATRKDQTDGHCRPWPEEAVMSDDIKHKIDSRLDELGLSSLIDLK